MFIKKLEHKNIIILVKHLPLTKLKIMWREMLLIPSKDFTV